MVKEVMKAQLFEEDEKYGPVPSNLKLKQYAKKSLEYEKNERRITRKHCLEERSTICENTFVVVLSLLADRTSLL